jgi:hypothetical protein
MANPSALAIAANIFTSPGQAFPVIKEHRKVFLPIVMLIAAYSAVSLVYTSAVDLPWLMESQLEASNPDMPAEQREQAVTAATRLPAAVYGAIGAISASAVVLLWLFITALYYTGVSFVTHDGVKLKQWFALICWCTLPVVFGALAQVVNVLANDARFMTQDEMNPLAFGNLLSIDRTGVTIVQRVLLSIDVTTLWALVLTVLGYQAWTASSIVKAVAVVLGPVVVIVAISSAVALV